MSAEGNFEGHNILNRLKSLNDQGRDEGHLAALRSMLHQERSKRVRPGLDDKVLADWNGLMIAGLAHAATAFDRPDWLTPAKAAYEFVARSMTRGDRLGHSWRDGKLLFPGLASDYAAMTRAALALHEATGEQPYLDQAVRWQTALDRHYAGATHGGYYLTADDAEGLIIRPHATIDDAIPNHNGLIAQNLVRLAVLTGDDRWGRQRDALFSALLPSAIENMFGHLSILNALDLHLNGAEIVVVGETSTADALLKAARRLPHTTTIVSHVSDAATLPASHPARAKVAASNGAAAAFLCRGQSCSLPVKTPEDLIKLAATTTA